MPETPTAPISDYGPQAQSGSGFSPSVTPSAFGADLGRTLEGIGSEYQQYALREKNYHDQESVQDLIGQAQIKRLQLKDNLNNQDFNDPKSLHEATDKVLSDYNQQIDEIANKAGNDRQKEMLAHSLRAERFDTNSYVTNYAIKQGNKIAYSSMKNGNKISQADAASFYDVAPPPEDGVPESLRRPAEDGLPVTPADRVTRSIALQKQRIADTGQHLHWTPEQIQEEQAQAVNNTHVAVLQSMLAPGRDASQAVGYFQAHKDELSSQEQVRLGSSVENARIAQQSDAVTHDLMYQKDSMGIEYPRNPIEVRQMLGNDKRLQNDPRLAKAVDEQVERKLRINHEAQTEAEGDLYNKVYTAMSKNGWDRNADGIPAVWDQMSVEHRNALTTLIHKDGEVKTDPATWSRYDDVLSDPTRRDEAKQLDVLSDAGKLSLVDLKGIKERIDRIRTGTDELSLAKDTLIKDVANTALLGIGKDPEIKPGGQHGDIQAAQYVSEFRKVLRNQIEANVKQTGKQMTRDDMQKLADDLLIPVKGTGEKGMIWNGDDKSTFQIPGALKDQAPVKDFGPGDFEAWQHVMADPHHKDFDASINKLQTMLSGIGADGKPNQNLPALANRVLSATVPPMAQQQITTTWKQTYGTNPTPSQVLSIWANHAKRTTLPKPVAPAPAVKPSALSGIVDILGVD